MLLSLWMARFSSAEPTSVMRGSGSGGNSDVVSPLTDDSGLGGRGPDDPLHLGRAAMRCWVPAFRRQRLGRAGPGSPYVCFPISAALEVGCPGLQITKGLEMVTRGHK